MRREVLSMVAMIKNEVAKSRQQQGGSHERDHDTAESDRNLGAGRHRLLGRTLGHIATLATTLVTTQYAAASIG